MNDLFITVKNLIKNCNYYKRDVYLNAENFFDFPFLTKTEVARNYSQFLPDRGNLVFTETSGSSGIPLKIAWTQEEYFQSLLPLWRMRNKNGINATDFYLTCHAGPYQKSDSHDNSVIVSKNYISLSKLCYSEAIAHHYLKQIRTFSPKWILAQPSFVYYLGNFAVKEVPELTYSFRYIELIGELVTKDIYDAIQNFFPASKIINMYGMQEFNGIMYGEDGPLTPMLENVFVEIVDDTGRPCSFEEEGNIVVTGLKNSTFPLVRYATGDRGKRLNDNKYVITKGRSNDELFYNNVRYDGSLFFEIINQFNKTHKPSISKFQVLYNGANLNFKLFSFEELPDNQELVHFFESRLLNIANINLPVVVEIMPEEFLINSKKVKYFINNLL